jgi:hypothetical protein
MELQMFSPVETALADLHQRVGMRVYDITNDEDIEQARSDRKEVQKFRTQVERIRKEAKEPHLEAGRQIDKAAKVLTAAIEKIEAVPLVVIEDADRKAARIEAERAAEAARIQAEVNAALKVMRDAPLDAIGKGEQEIIDAIEAMTLHLDVTNWYGRNIEADGVYLDALEKLTTLLTQANAAGASPAEEAVLPGSTPGAPEQVEPGYSDAVAAAPGAGGTNAYVDALEALVVTMAKMLGERGYGTVSARLGIYHPLTVRCS